MSIITISGAKQECEDFWNAFEAYNRAMVDWLGDPLLTPPSVLDISFKTPETFTAATLTQHLSANATSGYLVDLTHHMGAFNREIGMRYSSKSSYYTAAADEYTLEAENCSNSKAEYNSFITGNNQTI